MARKTAMVQKVAANLALQEVLDKIGNDRSYMLLSSRQTSPGVWKFLIHFDGDFAPKTIIYDGEKPDIE